MIDRFLKATARQSTRPMAMSHLSVAVAIGMALLYGPGIARAQQSTGSDSQDVPAPASAPARKTDDKIKDKQPVELGAGNGTGNPPIFDKAYGQLDASLTYQVTSDFSATGAVVNATNTKRRTMFGLETRPRGVQINNRMYSLKAMYSF